MRQGERGEECCGRRGSRVVEGVLRKERKEREEGGVYVVGEGGRDRRGGAGRRGEMVVGEAWTGLTIWKETCVKHDFGELLPHCCPFNGTLHPLLTARMGQAAVLVVWTVAPQFEDRNKTNFWIGGICLQFIWSELLCMRVSACDGMFANFCPWKGAYLKSN